MISLDNSLNSDASPIGVLRLGCEGGGETVIGQIVGGNWTFWSDGITMVLDEPEEGDETWRPFQRGPASSLEEILFDGWHRFHPNAMNEEFSEKIRSLYVAARAGSKHRRDGESSNHRIWEAAFAGKNPFSTRDLVRIRRSVPPAPARSDDADQMSLFDDE